ncbi:MAG: hypothetical protein ACOYMA_07790 [Bacteroidia bacterium]
MALGWNEIKDRALNFSKEWAGSTNKFELCGNYKTNLFTKEKVKKK